MTASYDMILNTVFRGETVLVKGLCKLSNDCL